MVLTLIYAQRVFCAKCGGPVASMGNATIRNRSVDNNNKRLTVNVELTGYENIKKQLNDIEVQIDRIIKKLNILNDSVKS